MTGRHRRPAWWTRAGRQALLDRLWPSLTSCQETDR